MHSTTRFDCVNASELSEQKLNRTSQPLKCNEINCKICEKGIENESNNSSHESSNKTKQIVFKFIKEQRQSFIHRKCRPFDSTQLITCKPSTATYLTNCLRARNKLILYNLVLSFRKQNVQIKCRAMPAYDRSHQSVKFDELQTLKSSNAFTTGSRASSILKNNGHVSQ